jgi:plexin B
MPQTAPAKVLDCDTITQVKEKLLEQAWKSMSFSQRPHTDSLHLGEPPLQLSIIHCSI